MQRTNVAMLLVGLALPLVAQGQIFKCVDEAGRVGYQGAFCPNGSEETRFKILGDRVVPYTATTIQPEIDARERIATRNSQARANREQQKASQVPILDVETSCRRVAEAGGGYDAGYFNRCIGRHQSAYRELQRVYDEYPEDIKTSCLRVASSGDGGDYGYLLRCLRRQDEALQNTPSFNY